MRVSRLYCPMRDLDTKPFLQAQTFFQMPTPEARLWVKKRFKEIFPTLGTPIPQMTGLQGQMGGPPQAHGQGPQPPHQPTTTGVGSNELSNAEGNPANGTGGRSPSCSDSREGQHPI